MPWWAWVLLGALLGGMAVFAGTALWLIRNNPWR